MTKHLLAVSPAYFDPHDIAAFLSLKKEGIETSLLATKNHTPPQGVFAHVIHAEMHKLIPTIEQVQSLGVKFDGVMQVCFEAASPLVAKLNQIYGGKGNLPEVAFRCRNKFLMREILNKAGLPFVSSTRCKNFQDIISAVESLKKPCVAKPIAAHSSFGTFFIPYPFKQENFEDIYNKGIEFLKESFNSGEDLYKFSQEDLAYLSVTDDGDLTTDYVVEEFVSGREISIDSVVQNGKVHVAGIALQTRMEPPYFVQLAEEMPLVTDVQTMAAIKKVNEDAINALGITDSCTHCEIFLSPEGPKVCEIACRMGGDNISDSVLQTGGTNLCLEASNIALGRPVTVGDKILSYTAMEYILPKKKGMVKGVIVPEDIKNSKNITEIFIHSCVGDKDFIFAPPPEGFDYVLYLSSKGSTREEAQAVLREAVAGIQIIYS